MFKAFKALDAKREVPAMTNGNGDMIYDHGDISDMVAEQLRSDSQRIWRGGDVNLVIDEKEIAKALRNSPTNTACGNDNIGYPFLRFWFKNQPDHMTKSLNGMIRKGYEG